MKTTRSSLSVLSFKKILLIVSGISIFAMTSLAQSITTSSPLPDKCAGVTISDTIEADGPPIGTYSWSALDVPDVSIEDATIFLSKASHSDPKKVIVTGTAPPVSSTTTYGFKITLVFEGSAVETKQFEFDVHPSPALNLGNDTSICLGATVTLDAGAGMAGYTWSTGDATQTVDAATTGNYSVTVTDANGCQNSDSISLIAYSVPVIQLDTIIHESHTGAGDGAIEISVSEGTMPYDYTWNTNDTTRDISGLTAGTYILTVTDTNQCSDTGTYIVDLLTDTDAINNISNPYQFQVIAASHVNSFIIEYKLPFSLHITLESYDITGRKVQSISNGFKAKGMYQHYFTPSAGNTGNMYILCFKAGNSIIIKKIIHTE